MCLPRYIHYTDCLAHDARMKEINKLYERRIGGDDIVSKYMYVMRMYIAEYIDHKIGIQNLTQ